MGLYDKFLDIFTEPVDNSKPKKSFMDIFYEDDSKPVEKKPKHSFMDIFFKDDDSDKGLVDAKDINSTFNTISGRIKFLKKRIDEISMAVYSVDNSIDSLDQNKFTGAKDLILQYCKLIECFKTFEPYSNVQGSDLSVTDRATLESNLDQFEFEFNKQLPDVKTLCWLNEMCKANNEMQNLYDRGTLRDLTSGRIEDIEIYIHQIANQSGEFSGYKNQLVNELMIAEYRLNLLKLMRDIGIGKDFDKSPFANSGDVRKTFYTNLFDEDVKSFIAQQENIMGLKRVFVEDAKLYSKGFFDKLDSDTDKVLTALNQFKIGDYSVDEVFSDGKGFQTLLCFLAVKLRMNTMKSRYHQYLQNAPIKKRKNSAVNDDDFDIGN